ncbi:MAG: hypothetical protein ACK55I_35040, partial [bacterium]
MQIQGGKQMGIHAELWIKILFILCCEKTSNFKMKTLVPVLDEVSKLKNTINELTAKNKELMAENDKLKAEKEKVEEELGSEKTNNKILTNE